ncbi:hypothetical protein [Actinoallomurus iriomotensis]|uniref:LigA protein n=1 Tax=Actinoallomurus iriomotensis TaxID=478107 RepID=A0A9W6RQS2_9ACTN|nr:hypothetical protein [Actinoallomurus iriomotensis]GLY78447.1 hypothetical protein Airi01_067140 [Actinoallomurus iriomotensis]
MTRTTAAPSVDLAQVIPGLGAYARTTVRLHPRPGSPGPRDSHIGGPLAWPASEAWPHCETADCDLYLEDPGSPMVALVQLTAADFPEITFPDGTDLLQILWCVGYHGGAEDVPCRLVWRRAAEVTEILQEPPVPDLEDELPGFYETYIPRPCVLHPERVIEYPWIWDLPEDLRDRVQAWDQDKDQYEQLSTAPGFKIGGTAIHGSVPSGLKCVVCDAPTVLFLQLDNGEGDGRWCAVEDGQPDYGTPEYDQVYTPTGMLIDVGPGGLLACSADFGHPVVFHRQ